MANLGTTIDPRTIPPDDRSFELIPSGTIAVAHITESDVKPTKSNNGTLAELTWEILDGPYKGRKIWERVNIRNQNPQAQEIGQRHLSAICVASGVGAVADTQQLHYKPCLVKIGIEKGTGNYEDKNKIAGVKPVGSMVPATAGVSHPQAKGPAQPAQPAWDTPARPTQPQPGSTPWGATQTQGNATAPQGYSGPVPF